MSKQETLYSRESSDDMARFLGSIGVLVWFGAGLVYLIAAAFDKVGFFSGLCLSLLYAFLVFGMKCRIDVYEDRVRIIRSCWWVPYWIYRGKEITGIWYGGDFGESDGAVSIVVELDGEKEISFGSKADMNELHSELSSMSAG